MPARTIENRIIWLDCLRALAVCLVLWGHLCLVGINDAATVNVWVPSVQSLIFGPGSDTANPSSKIAYWMWIYTRTGPGGFGVALFFLISGFVILRTLDRVPVRLFLIRRFFRLIPVCATVSILVGLGVNHLYHAKGLPGPNDVTSIVAASLGSSGLFGRFVTNPVIWTLSAEITFYFLIASVAACSKDRIGFEGLGGASMFCLLAVLLAKSPPAMLYLPSPLVAKLSHVSELLGYCTIMLIGSVVYRGYTTNSPRRAVGWGVALTAMSGLTYLEFTQITGIRFGIWPAEAGLALVVFLAAFALSSTGRWTRPLRWIADISYPLYLVHVPLGWVILAWLGSRHLGAGVSVVCTVALVTFVAWLLHILIEDPAHRLGKRIGRPKRSIPAATVLVG